MELEIPKIIAAYNGVKNNDFMARYDLDTAGEHMDPRRCVGCGGCAAICPQGIDVPGIMKAFPELLEKTKGRGFPPGAPARPQDGGGKKA